MRYGNLWHDALAEAQTIVGRPQILAPFSRNRTHRRLGHLFIRLHLGILAAIEIEHEEPKCRRKIGVLALIIHLADQFRQGRNTSGGNRDGAGASI